MAWLFVATDPEGRSVGLNEERWQQHIVARRPYMKNYVPDVQGAIARPQVIHMGNRPFTLVYTGQPFSSGFHRGEFIRAIARFDRAHQRGEVLTAYITSQDYKGVTVWTPQ